MRGVSIPTFEYGRVADLLLQISDSSILPTTRIPDRVAIVEKAMLMVNATRAYNRVLLRLRAQAEKDSRTPSQDHSVGANISRASNRLHPSGVACTHSPPLSEKCCCDEGVTLPLSDQGGVLSFRSSIFSLNRAPLLRVFVPSPAGEWLSNTSILECEAELKSADMLGQMRLGDVVWDLAVGDHGNAGKLIWDGSYLIDLDYTYSPIGDIPKYIPGFAFPPSYFHRIIRSSTMTPSQSDDPIIRLDLTPWGAEIISNVKLVEDRVRVKSAQGVYQEIVHWVHRSSFHLHALAIDKCNFTSSAAQDYHLNSDVSASITATTPLASRIPIPDTTLFVDPDWYGRIVIETEGTNEALADLQERCGMAEFPTAQGRRVRNKKREQEWEGRMVYRILPERSRPGERWIRAVSPKQKFLT
ncbi:hypothetical protein BT96DRAFT_831917 [Gymnopus androsaceus JB14]|uniref:Uncharacterized protein n=1 Tax=Gymnopus androsaceus JB14 TaxID=1447944 RepID=A0A6A4H1D6_9AGAR|nr:hypothetical protein BT96DRAFT_831917 [Gymnopus androsaceus JB14]